MSVIASEAKQSRLYALFESRNNSSKKRPQRGLCILGVKLQCSNFIIPIKNYLDELEKPENVLLFKQLETFTENLKIA